MLRFNLPVLASFVIILAGCSSRGDTGGDRAAPDAGSTDGAVRDGSVSDAGAPGGDAGPPSCSEAARWIYLVDSSNQFLRFEPDSHTLTMVGTLACPAASGATPFSMGVDRNAVAWVLFNDGTIFDVDITTAACSATSFVPNQMGFQVFGMGFVSDTAGSATESLYIAGGPLSGIGGGASTLGRIDPTTLSVSRIGGVSGSPELTGNAAAELWGFFPDSTPMTVQQLDKGTGSPLRTFDVSAIGTSGTVGPSGATGGAAWAFAFWGGRYYIFYQGLLDASTNIWRMTPDTGAVEPVEMNIGHRIVGAGVSTCAPLTLI